MVIISEDDGERLQKALARAGIASRRTCEEMITAGRVMVNGKIVKKLGTKIDPATDKVTVDGLAVSIKPDNAPQKIYIALNKPVGYLSTVTDPQGRPTIMDLVKTDQRLFPIGRLDADTEGLLLLTNDGTFANALMHPRHNVEKEYMALLDGFPRMTELAILRRGVDIPIEDHETGEHIMYKTHPAQVDFIRREGSNTLVKFVLTEGKKRQIRLMAETIGHPVLQLTRVSFGSLKLGDLVVGKSRRLTAGEVKGLLELAAGEKKPRVERIDEPKAGFGQPPRSGNRTIAQPTAQERFPTRTPSRSPERGSGQAPWRKPEGDNSPERGAGRPPERRSEQAPWRKPEGDRAPERGVGRPFERRSEQAPWRKPEGDSERRTDRAPERGAGRPFERRSEQAPWRKPEGDRGPERGAGRPFEQRREQTPWRKPEGDSERRRDGAPERGAGRPFEQRREQTPWRKPEGDNSAERGAGSPPERRSGHAFWRKPEGDSERRRNGTPERSPRQDTGHSPERGSGRPPKYGTGQPSYQGTERGTGRPPERRGGQAPRRPLAPPGAARNGTGRRPDRKS